MHVAHTRVRRGNHDLSGEAHRDTYVVMTNATDPPTDQFAIPVVDSKRPVPPRGKRMPATRLLRHRVPPPPACTAAGGVADSLRGTGGAASAMAEEGELMGPAAARPLDEAGGVETGGEEDTRARPATRVRTVFCTRPEEVLVPAAPLRRNPLIRKRLVPNVNAVERGCENSSCENNTRHDSQDNPRQVRNAIGNPAALCAVAAPDVSVRADSTSSGAAPAQAQKVNPGSRSAVRRESRRCCRC